ncbi:MAG: hypothetical protein K0U37_08660 [Gammaproteobacteria bacterium]|nr:hypothetical protein [Gammaproteobacteria bacterium]
MEIIFDGRHDGEEASESLASIIKLFKERYQIGQFREMHLSITLVDDKGEDVELIDSETNQPYRVFEVYRSQKAYAFSNGVRHPSLKLVVDNTRNNE